MFYYLSEFKDVFSPLRIFQYITFRAFAAGATAFVISLILGPPMIRRLIRLKLGQEVRKKDVETLYELHGKKQGTPTMGGVLILASATISSLLWANPETLYIWLAIASLVVMGGLGMWDDYTKITRKNPKGISGKIKLLVQLGWVIVLTSVLWFSEGARESSFHFMVPFIKDPVIQNIGWLGGVVFFYLVLSGASNAVNLTDGLDGLAAGCGISVALAYLVFSYVAGHAVFASYLQLPHIPGAGELSVFCGALMGGCLGFLWYNCYPAKVFMGDTGSLALGGSLGTVAILTKQELLLIIVGGVFVMEALSVILQVASFKSTGKRIFRCAPIHHHFELLEKEKAEKSNRPVDVIETMITTRFWILSIICALIGVATLKIR